MTYTFINIVKKKNLYGYLIHDVVVDNINFKLFTGKSSKWQVQCAGAQKFLLWEREHPYGPLWTLFFQTYMQYDAVICHQTNNVILVKICHFPLTYLCSKAGTAAGEASKAQGTSAAGSSTARRD